MSLVSAPTRSDFESVDLSPTECSAILEKIEEPMVRVLVVVIAVTGARASEVLGLRWADLDFKKGRIHIRRAGMQVLLVPVQLVEENSKQPDEENNRAEDFDDDYFELQMKR